MIVSVSARDPFFCLLASAQGTNKGVIKISGINLHLVCSSVEHQVPHREYLRAKLQMNANAVTRGYRLLCGVAYKTTVSV
jgi:hypothetical protein